MFTLPRTFARSAASVLVILSIMPAIAAQISNTLYNLFITHFPSYTITFRHTFHCRIFTKERNIFVVNHAFLL